MKNLFIGIWLVLTVLIFSQVDWDKSEYEPCTVTKVNQYIGHRHSTDTACECIDQNGLMHSVVTNGDTLVVGDKYDLSGSINVFQAFIISIFLGGALMFLKDFIIDVLE